MHIFLLIASAHLPSFCRLDKLPFVCESIEYVSAFRFSIFKYFFPLFSAIRAGIEMAKWQISLVNLIFIEKIITPHNGFLDKAMRNDSTAHTSASVCLCALILISGNLSHFVSINNARRSVVAFSMFTVYVATL